MANESQRVLEILLRLKADAAGAQQIKTELQAVQAQATQTATTLQSLSSPSRRIVDNSNPAPQTAAQLAADAASAERTREILRNRTATTAVAARNLVLDEKSVIAAELSAAAEAKKVVQMERQLIMEIQLEAAEARMAGNPAMAAKLDREAAIRLQALTIQRATNVSMEVALAQAERLIIAQEVGNARAGAGMTFTRGQATALAQQLANGRISAESISRSFSGFGSYLSIAAVAGYGIYNVFSNLSTLSEELTREYESQVIELSKQVPIWTQLAQEASTFSDEVKLGEQMLQPLDALAKKLDEISKKKLGAGQKITDFLGLNQFVGAETNEQAAAAGTANQAQLLQEGLELRKSLLDVAAQSKRAFDADNVLPLADAIEKVTGSLEELRAKHEQLRSDFIDALTKAQELGRLAAERAPFESPEDQKESTKQWQDQLQIARQLYGQLVQTGHALDQNDSRLKSITGEADTLDKRTRDIAEGIQKWELSELDPNERIPQLNLLLDDTLEKLRAIGITETDPAKAAAQMQSIELTKEQAGDANDLLLILLEIVKAIRSANDEQEKSDDKKRREAATAAQQELNASLRAQETLLQRIHGQQQLIAANPFLSADQKQALTLASMTAQMAALGGAIAQTKQRIAGSALDPVTHERLQAALQRDQFEFDNLKLKIDAIDQPFGTALVDWVNQMGTSAQQVAGLITNSLGTAISGISQSITGLIIGTKDWEQAWNNAVVSILGGIVQMVVQWIAGQVAMFVVRQIFGKQEAATVSSLATSSAAAWAPAATSASIASYGAAAGFGVAAYIAALAAGTAAATGAAAIGGAAGGFKRGGYTGDGGVDEIAGPVHKREFVFDEASTSRIGLRNLYALAQDAPHFQEGGPALPGHPGPIEPGILPGSGGYYGNMPRESYHDLYTPRPHWWRDPLTGNWHLVNIPGSGAGLGLPGYPHGYYDNPFEGAGAEGDPGSGAGSGGTFYPPPGYTGPGSTPFGGLTIVGHDTVTGAPIYRDSQGNLYTTPGTGTVITPGIRDAINRGDYTHAYGQSELSRASAFTMMMAGMNLQMSPKMVTGTGDAGHTMFMGDASSRNLSFEGGVIVRQPGNYIPSHHSGGFRGFAGGGFIPGPASTEDSILAMLSTGEYVMQARAVQHFGPDLMDAINNMRIPRAMPRFAAGGLASSSSSSASSSSRGGDQRPWKIIPVTDWRAAIREAQKDDGYRTYIVDTIKGAGHEVGLPAVN